MEQNAFGNVVFDFQVTSTRGDETYFPMAASISIDEDAVASGAAELEDVISLSFTAGSLSFSAADLAPYYAPYTVTFSNDRETITTLRSDFRRLGLASWPLTTPTLPQGNIAANRLTVTGNRVGLSLERLAEADGTWARRGAPVVPEPTSIIAWATLASLAFCVRSTLIAWRTRSTTG